MASFRLYYLITGGKELQLFSSKFVLFSFAFLYSLRFAIRLKKKKQKEVLTLKDREKLPLYFEVFIESI